MTKPLPRSQYVHFPGLKRAKYYLQHLTGVETPLPKIGEVVKVGSTRYGVFCKGYQQGSGAVV